MKPAWYTRSFRRLLLDFHFPDSDLASLEKLDAKKFIELASRSDVDSVVVCAKCHWGNSYYNTRIGHKHRGLGKTDFLGEVIEGCHKHDIRVLFYYSLLADTHASRVHPEWTVRDSRGRRVIPDKWVFVCHNSPYRNYAIAQLDELSGRYDPDGFWLDMATFNYGVCYCQSCRKLYRKAHGRSIPREDDNEKQWLEFIRWRTEDLTNLLQETRNVIKSNLPEAIVMPNYQAYMGWPSHSATTYAYAEVPECGTTEACHSSPSLSAELSRAVTSGRPQEVIIPRCAGVYGDWTMRPTAELEHEIFTALAHNATVSVVDQPYPDGTFEPSFYDQLRNIYRKVKRIEKYSRDSELLGYAGICFSEKSWLYHGLTDQQQQYGDTIAVALQMAVEEHLPTRIVLAEKMNLEGLRVLIVPRATVLADEEIQRLHEFVKSGGNLFVVGSFALLDPEYHKRTQPFALLGFDYAGTVAAHHAFIHPTSEDVFKHLSHRIDLMQRWTHYRLRPVSGRTLAYLALPCIKYVPKKAWISHGPEPAGSVTSIPAVHMVRLGKGKIIYVNGNPFYEYANLRSLWPRELLRGAISLFSPPLFETNAPSTVEIVVKKKRKTYIVHLLNYHLKRGAGVGDRSGPPVIEETVPLSDILLRTVMPVESARDEKGNQLDVTWKRGHSIIHLPKIVGSLVVTIVPTSMLATAP